MTNVHLLTLCLYKSQKWLSFLICRTQNLITIWSQTVLQSLSGDKDWWTLSMEIAKLKREGSVTDYDEKHIETIVSSKYGWSISVFHGSQGVSGGFGTGHVGNRPQRRPNRTAFQPHAGLNFLHYIIMYMYICVYAACMYIFMDARMHLHVYVCMYMDICAALVMVLSEDHVYMVIWQI